MNLSEEQQHVDEAYRERSKDSALTFIRGLKIPATHGAQQFYRCMASYQLESFKELVPSLEAIRDGRKPKQRRFWWERTKGASKDSDIACGLLWLVTFATRPLLIQVGAADRDQAGIVRRRMQDLLHYNPWLQDLVKIQNYKVMGMNGLATIEIVAADIAGSHGEAPDVLVLNELSHVTKWEFLENMLDNARKVQRGLIILATNAGFRGTKAEVLRKHAERSKYWVFRVLDKPAPWISREDLEEAKHTSKSRSRYRRLWWGEWASGKGDALAEKQIERVFRSDVEELTHPERGWQYLFAIDLGVKHDHSGVLALGVNASLRRLKVATLRAFQVPPGQEEIDLDEVENVILGLGKTFRPRWVGYDPHQAVLMAQRLRKRGLPMVEVPFTPKNLVSMAESLLQVMEWGILECFESDELRRDFGKFDIVEKPYGHRLEAVSDEYGHADVGTALVIALPKAIEMLDSPLFSGEDDITTEEEVTEENIDEMPEELREIYNMYGDEDDAIDVDAF